MTPMRIMALVRTLPGKHSLRRLQEDLQIQPERPPRRILEIETHHVVERHSTSAVHLPEAGDSWLHFEQASPVPEVVGLELVRNRRAWPDHRHLATEHIEELWELVETGLPEEASKAREAGIVGQLVNGLTVPFRRLRLA